ncbi:MAG: hypothetical protein M5U01_27995 [Ardenticatenaceae bacterium]|nr:hypothetical protein [Ardenticatenaceae bacterium]
MAASFRLLVPAGGHPAGIRAVGETRPPQFTAEWMAPGWARTSYP